MWYRVSYETVSFERWMENEIRANDVPSSDGYMAVFDLGDVEITPLSPEEIKRRDEEEAFKQKYDKFLDEINELELFIDTDESITRVKWCMEKTFRTGWPFVCTKNDTSPGLRRTVVSKSHSSLKVVTRKRDGSEQRERYLTIPEDGELFQDNEREKDPLRKILKIDYYNWIGNQLSKRRPDLPKLIEYKKAAEHFEKIHYDNLFKYTMRFNYLTYPGAICDCPSVPPCHCKKDIVYYKFHYPCNNCGKIDNDFNFTFNENWKICTEECVSYITLCRSCNNKRLDNL